MVVAGSFYVQTSYISPVSLLLSLVPGALISLLLMVNQYSTTATTCKPVKEPGGAARPAAFLTASLPAAARRLYPADPGIKAAAGSTAGWGRRPVLSAAAAAGILSAKGQTASGNKPGKLILLSYTLTLTLLVLGIYLH